VSLWRQLGRGLRVLVRRAEADREVAEEVQHYLEQATAAHLARGLSPAEARRAAQLELGNATVVREQVRAYGWENLVGTTVADLRYAWRQLRGSPGFTVVAVLTLALGIGAATAVFSAVNPILFEPLPYPHADRLLMISDVRDDGSPEDVTYGTYRELAVRGRAFDALAVADQWQPALMGTGEPERLHGQLVSADFFRVLGVAPAVGRDFDASDDQPQGPRVAILSDGLARRRFGGAGAILGRAITLEGEPYTVIGVMPPGFDNVLAPSAEVWAPRQYRAAAPFESAEWGHHMRMAGRLKPAMATDQAVRDIEAIARTLIAEFPRPPWADLKQGLGVHSLQTDVVRGAKPALLAILGAVLLVLVIACVNVTNLLLARGARRRGELAMRAALGAGRPRLVRQLLTESVLLAALGGAAGIAVALLGVRALVGLAPAGLPRVGAIRLDGPVFVFALAITALIGLAVGLVPAFGASRGSLHAGLQQGTRRASGGHATMRSTLVVAEVALALVLLVGAGLLLRSMERLFAVAPGFEPSHVLTMQVEAAGRAFYPDSAKIQYYARALEAVRAVPGVTSAAFTSQLPLSGDLDGYGVLFESIPPAKQNDYGNALRYAVTPGYLETMRIPLRRGRLLDEHDATGDPEAILVNESFARRVFPGRDPIGQRVRMGPEIDTAGRPWDVVVGVVGDVKQQSLAEDAPGAFYVPMSRWMWVDNVQSLVVRTRGDAAALAPDVMRAVWSVNKDQPIARVATMGALVEKSAAQLRFSLTVFEAFALAALALAAIGVYGVLAGSVAERTREIGIRSALGASRGGIVALVLHQSLSLTGLGLAVGLAGAVAASRALVALLFGTSRLDPLTYLGVVALLVGVSAIASAVPAWRAARVDPSITLRAE
jgi:putative ABC transport system permease protein